MMKFKVIYRTPDGGKGEKVVEGRSRTDAAAAFQVMFPVYRIIGLEKVGEEGLE